MRTSEASLEMLNSEKRDEVKSISPQFYRRPTSQKIETAPIINIVKDLNMFFNT